MKIMITGFSGFVARYFLEYLDGLGEPWEVTGVDLHRPTYDYTAFRHLRSVRFYEMNLFSEDCLDAFFREHIPDYVLHLAAFSSVAYSWQHPAESFLNNSNIFLNLMEVIRKYHPACRVLSVGSSEEYGNVPHDCLPITEEEPLRPVSPYAVARVAQEQLSRIYFESFGVQVVMTRSFNHIGPRQDTRFVIPGFVRKIVSLAGDSAEGGVIETGDISVIRDFVDVRDVVRAYDLLLREGTPGAVYNICSGQGISLERMIDMIAGIVGVRVRPVQSEALLRPNDNREVIGSREKIFRAHGWKPEIPIAQTLRDMIAFETGEEHGLFSVKNTGERADSLRKEPQEGDKSHAH